jgi:pimeloyl-ACP methyl ester carboxylesterase
MDRIYFQNSRHLTLVGCFHEADSAAAIVMAHGFTNDKSSQGRFDQLAESFNRNGYNVLRFDFSGCGESAMDILSTHNMIDDLHCAIEFVKKRSCTAIGLYGHSLGGLICLKCDDPAVRTMVLTGAPTDYMKYDWTEYYADEQLREIRAKGYLTARDRSGNDRLIGRQILRSFEEINQKELLGAIHCPILLIHGNDPNDWEETQLLEKSKKGINLLPVGSQLEIIDGANHTFRDHLDRVIERANDWYKRQLPLSSSV